MENPYKDTQERGLLNALEAAKHHAWGECHAEQAEIVSELVGAAQDLLNLMDEKALLEWGLEIEDLEHAIAKATGI